MMKTGKLTAWLLAMLGFTGCEINIDDDGGGGENLMMYGTPYATFEVKGTVTDGAGAPVKDIKIVVTDDREYLYNGELAVGITDGAGNYRVGGYWIGSPPLTVTAEDIDGDKNGGQFETGVLELKNESADYVGGEGWNRGRYTFEAADLELELKSQNDESE